MRVGLKVLVQFKQGKHDTYLPGAFIPEEQWQGWEPITLSNRLANKYVEWTPVPEDGAATVQDEPVIAELDKEGLILYAEERFGAKLDRRMSEKTMREQLTAMTDRAKLLAAQDARGLAMQRARTVGSAATVGAKGSASSPKAPATPPSAPAAPVDDTGTEQGDDTGGGPATGDTNGAGDPQAS